MEPEAAKKATEGTKRFVLKMEDEDVSPVKPLFKPSSASGPSPVPNAPVVSKAVSYADYVVDQAGPFCAPQLKQGPPVTTAPATAPVEDVPAQPSESKNTIDKASVAEGKCPPMIPAVKPGAKRNSMIVSPRQRGNPVLKFVRNVPWEFGEIVPDYVLGQSTCALFLSLRYHNLNPNYIHERLQKLGKTYLLQVLLVQVDVKDPQRALKELAKICILADCSLILAWSPEEAGRYLETYKAYEKKPADMLKEKVDRDYLSRFFIHTPITAWRAQRCHFGCTLAMTDCLTSVRSVNKTDTLTLLSAFGSFASITQASKEDLSLCPGIGPQKAKRLYDVLHQPFLKRPK